MRKDIQQILFGLIDNEKGWSSLTASDWIALLCNNREYIEKCDKANGWQLFTVKNWFELLKQCPDYESKFGEYEKQLVASDVDMQSTNPFKALTWTTLDEHDWIDLIKNYPRQADKYRQRIHDYDVVWDTLLNALKNPGLGFDWFGDGWLFLNSAEWMKLLKTDQSYVTKFTEFEGWRKFTVGDTIELFKARPSIIEVYPDFEMFDASEWVLILDNLPLLAEKCDEVDGWHNFGKTQWNWPAGYASGVEFENCWAHLLSKHPEWADRCDKFNGWDDFTTNDWLELLKSQPEFANRCERVNGWGKFTRRNWVKLLQKQPRFAVLCTEHDQWLHFDGFDWVELLRERPEFADECARFGGWLKLDFTAISCGRRHNYITHGKIMGERHESIRVVRIDGVRHDCVPYCGPSEYLYYDENGAVVLRTKDKPLFCGRWAELLEKQPQFAKMCDEYNGWEAFDGFDWYVLLSAQPCFVNKCSDLDGWEKIFNFRPKESLNLDGIVEYSYEKYYDVPIEYEKTFGRGKRLATKSNPDGQSVLPVFCWMRPEYCNVSRSQKEIDDDKHWKEYEVKALTETHDSQKCTPELEALIKLFKEANPYQEPNPYPDPYHIGSHGNRGVLSESEVGEIAVRLPKDFWVYFLNQNPRAAMAFAKKYGVGNVWATFTIYDWEIAIENRTEFVNEICSFEGHDDFADALLSAWPGFLDHLGYLPKEYAGQIDADAWVVECRVWPFLIRHRPDLAVHMTWEDWKRFSGNNWECLLHPRWRYIERAKVPMDGGHWWLCLSKAPQFATLCEQYGGWDKLSTHYLCDLLNKHADLVEYCVKHLKWDELTPDNWVHLLKKRPQLADRCEIVKGWLKFKGGDWQVLLCAQPKLECHCDSSNGWKLLNEGDWMRLINRQSHFAAKYNEVHTSMGIEPQNGAEVVEKAREFVTRERRRIERERFISEFDEHYGDFYEDWREASGWNDVYGVGVEASDIIDFGD